MRIVIKDPRNWPSFRGEYATGVADGQHPPSHWDTEKNYHVRWKTPIPGLAHSCPIVWGDRLFVTTAVGEPNPKVKTGQYGDVESDRWPGTLRAWRESVPTGPSRIGPRAGPR